MIYFDVSRTLRAKHRSGLTRVGSRLLKEFGDTVKPVSLLVPGGGLSEASAQFHPSKDDWWLTPELFCEAEFPGLWTFFRKRRCRLAAVFHDAIPLKHPHITWPQSVSRHPEYMRMLAEFDRVFAVSEASRQELLGFWRWQGVEPRAVVETISLGADFSGLPRVVRRGDAGRAALLCVGILEPRKNQTFLLEVCESLWRDGFTFDLHLVGRVNPHFGQPVLTKVKALKKRYPGLRYHAAVDDETLARLLGEVRASVFPTIAEGCGLPLLESLWQGVPCLCSDLPVLRENADAGGCLCVPVGELERWREALRRVLTEAEAYAELVRQTANRPLPSWADTAKALAERLT